MSTSNNKSWFWLLLLFAGGVYLASDRPGVHPPTPPAVVRPATPHLSVEVPEHNDYNGVVAQLQKWHAEAPDLTEFGSYGTSRKGQQLHFLRVTNLLSSEPRPEVLITACIHGNEPLSTSVVMGYIGRLLSHYGMGPRDTKVLYSDYERVTQLLDTRDIYFVPVVSPDSYPNSRYVDGVDPNRDFPGPHDEAHTSTPSIAALQVLFKQHNFKAAWSSHTFGRQFLYPFGDSTSPSPDDVVFQKFFGELGSLARYSPKPAHDLYGHPIRGSEVDWYYRANHAVSCVVEMGTASVGGQRPARPAEIKEELDRTWPAFLKFLQEAPTLLAPTPSPVSPQLYASEQTQDAFSRLGLFAGLPVR